MVNIIVIAHSEIANSFAYCVEHIMAKRVSELKILAIKKTDSYENILAMAKSIINKLSAGSEVLILTDIYGATPSNIANILAKKDQVEVITGLNLPMLIRALSYSKYGLKVCVEKSIEGAKTGIMHLSGDSHEE